MTLYAQWIKRSYRIITFIDEKAAVNTNDETFDPSVAVTLNALSGITGYTFDGWYNNAQFEGAAITGWAAGTYNDLTLYAHWTADTYTVTLNDDGGSGGQGSVTAVYNEMLPNVTIPKKSLSVFSGYYTTQDDSGDLIIDSLGHGISVWNIASDKMLYAHWEPLPPNMHVVTYIINPKSVVIDTDLIKNPNPILLDDDNPFTLKNPSHLGYAFIGWYDNELYSNKIDSSTPHTDYPGYPDSIALYGQWQARTFALTYKNEDGSDYEDSVSDEQSSHTYGTQTELPVPTSAQENMELGWHLLADCSDTPITTLGETDITSDTTLYGKWTGKQYNIIYRDMNDQEFSGDISGLPTKHTYGAVTDLGAGPTRNGYSFDGWFRDSSCQTLPVTEIGAQDITADTKIYAKWSGIEYSLRYFDKDGEPFTGFNKTLPHTHTCGTTTNLRRAFKSGGMSDGWHLLADCTDTAVDKIGSEAAPAGNVINLYVDWTPTEPNNTSEQNIVLDDETILCSALVKVCGTPVSIVGSDENWSTYGGECYDLFKGVFVKNRNVRLSPYRIGEYEVTQQLFETVMNTTISLKAFYNYEQDDGRTAAFNVSWYDAITFCNKLSIKLGLNPCYSVKIDGDEVDWENIVYGDIPTTDNSSWNAPVCDWETNGYRLPTEAEWEFAARGGNEEADDWKFAFAGAQSLKPIFRANQSVSDEDYSGNYLNIDSNLASVGWYNNNGNNKIRSSSQRKAANRLGLYNFSGNVSEWCWDWHDQIRNIKLNDVLDENGFALDPVGGAAVASGYRVVRGGSYYDQAAFCTISARPTSSEENTPCSRVSTVGLRLAQTITE